MSIVVYQCDTCSRKIEIPREVNSVETAGNCVITEGCLGRMFQVSLLEDFIRGKPLTPDEKLTDKIKKSSLYNRNVSVPRITWKINHQMRAFPLPVVMVDRPTTSNPNYQIRKEPAEIKYLDENTVLLTFDRAESGSVQLVAFESIRSAQSTVDNTTITTRRVSYGTGNRTTLTIAIRPGFGAVNIPVSVKITTNNKAIIYQEWHASSSLTINSPWRSYSSVVIGGYEYELRDLTAMVSSIPNGSTVELISINDTAVKDYDMDTVLVLLSVSPYGIFDLNLREAFIPTGQMTMSSGFLSVRQTDIKQFYPEIVTKI